MASKDRQRRSKASRNLMLAVAAAGAVPEREMKFLTTAAGYLSGGAWSGFLRGSNNHAFERDGSMVVLTAWGRLWVEEHA